jgi:hypothetical protein
MQNKRITHKFRAIRTEFDGIKFASKKECKRYTELLTLKKLEKIQLFLRQTPFHLAGGVKYICDFVVFWSDGEVTFEDVKGVKTPVYIAKKKMVEATYGISIMEI